MDLVASLLLVAMPGAPSSFLFLVAFSTLVLQEGASFGPPEPPARSRETWQLMQLFDKFGQQSKGVVYKRAMENMLGKCCQRFLMRVLEASGAM